MHQTIKILKQGAKVSIPIFIGIGLIMAALFSMYGQPAAIHANPIDPPDGFPKLSLSTKIVTPTLANMGGEILFYHIEIWNTGAYTATNTTMVDVIPVGTEYNHDAIASSGIISFSGGELSWLGDVGFDETVIISFSVDVADINYEGVVSNTAVISQALIAEPVTVTAETTITDDPILVVEKTAVPALPGANKPLTYTLTVINLGQPMIDETIIVTDELPIDTTFNSVGSDGTNIGNDVIWTRAVTLAIGESTDFTFSINVGDVPSGTIVSNDTYQVSSVATGITAGDTHTTTVVDPILTLRKTIMPDPAGSNRNMTYILSLFNQGSLATNLIITDVVPFGVAYVDGGTQNGDVISWTWPTLDTDESAEFTFTVFISDVANVGIINGDYGACSSEGICVAGQTITNVVQPAHFAATASLNPIAKKPGGGGGSVTPTLTIENLGPGNALDATALLQFRRISVSEGDLLIIPATGSIAAGPDCGDKCVNYLWTGDIAYGEIITFTTIEGQSTIGGEEGTPYTATVVITDSLGDFTTEPVTATAVGNMTHFSYLNPDKSAPIVIGRGQLLTYSLSVWNSGLTAPAPPYPLLTDTVPLSVTFVSASDGGVTSTVNGRTVVSWTLPALGTGDTEYRTFTVRVNNDLISGTQIVNEDYRVEWFDTAVFSNTGKPVTTTVKEIGLIDSYKEVTPTMALPGPNNVLTFFIHIVNSSPITLSDVTVYDYLPWQDSTYQQDAVASAGQIISDIVSVEWTGNVAAFSKEVITLTVLVDDGYMGAITNTAVISHPDLLNDVTVEAVAYITDQPVLFISKTASPNPVPAETELLYTIRVENLGQLATSLIITDMIPVGTTYVADSATAGGQLTDGVLEWETLTLEPNESQTYQFRVTVGRGRMVINHQYGVLSGEGIFAVGSPVVTRITGGSIDVFLPVILK